MGRFEQGFVDQAVSFERTQILKRPHIGTCDFYFSEFFQSSTHFLNFQVNIKCHQSVSQ